MAADKKPWGWAHVLFIALALVVLQVLWRQAQIVEPVPYSDIEEALAAGTVERVVIADRQLIAYLKQPDAKGKRALAANRVETDLADRLAQFDVPYEREFGSNWFSQLLGWVAPPLQRSDRARYRLRGS